MPPVTPIMLTLPRGPGSAWDGALAHAHEVVPQTKACAPKTKKIAIATHGIVVSASTEVGERLDDQADAHDVAEADVPLQPAVGSVPTMPPQAAPR